jgi:hypothetical protein
VRAALFRQTIAQRSNDQRKQRIRVPKPNLGLRRVNIHIDFRRIDRQPQIRDRVVLRHDESAVGLRDRHRQLAIANPATVHEHVLTRFRRNHVVDGRRERMKARRPAHALDFEKPIGIGITDHRTKPFAPRGGRGDFEGLARVGAALEREPGFRQRDLRQQFHDRGLLRPRRLHELAACRDVEEEVPHFDRRSDRCSDLERPGAFTTRHDEACAECRPTAARGDFHAGDRGDRRKGLAAEAERRDREKIVDIEDLRRRVRQDGAREIVGVHSRAVVGDPETLEPPLRLRRGHAAPRHRARFRRVP